MKKIMIVFLAIILLTGAACTYIPEEDTIPENGEEDDYFLDEDDDIETEDVI